MALAAPPITKGKGLLDLLQQAVPLQERAVELYRRLLAINDLAASMNAARDVGQLQECMEAVFKEWMPDVSISLCIADGSCYRRSSLSGPNIFGEEGTFALEDGMIGKVLRSGAPLFVQGTCSSGKPPASYDDCGAAMPACIIALPFTALGRVVGVLEIISERPNRFDEIDYHLAFLVSAHLSSSLENVLTRQELASANARLHDHDRRLTQLNQQLQQLAHTDDLTGLFNKRRLFEQLAAEIARARRYGEILSCLMIDIDDFKQINDSMGHQAGDEVLRQVGTLLRRSFRVTDFVARYGGEEFTVLLPRTDGSGARRVAEILLHTMKAHEFVLPTTKTHLTVSIGIASCTKFDRLDSQQVILRADNALYCAKRAGKDRVCYSEESDSDRWPVNILSRP